MTVSSAFHSSVFFETKLVKDGWHQYQISSSMKETLDLTLKLYNGTVLKDKERLWV